MCERSSRPNYKLISDPLLNSGETKRVYRVNGEFINNVRVCVDLSDPRTHSSLATTNCELIPAQFVIDKNTIQRHHKTQIVVYNLFSNMDSNYFHNFMSSFCSYESVNIFSGFSSKYAVVSFVSQFDAFSALNKLDGRELFGRKLYSNYYDQPPDKGLSNQRSLTQLVGKSYILDISSSNESCQISKSGNESPLVDVTQKPLVSPAFIRTLSEKLFAEIFYEALYKELNKVLIDQICYTCVDNWFKNHSSNCVRVSMDEIALHADNNCSSNFFISNSKTPISDSPTDEYVDDATLPNSKVNTELNGELLQEHQILTTDQLPLSSKLNGTIPASVKMFDGTKCLDPEISMYMEACNSFIINTHKVCFNDFSEKHDNLNQIHASGSARSEGYYVYPYAKRYYRRNKSGISPDQTKSQNEVVKRGGKKSEYRESRLQQRHLFAYYMNDEYSETFKFNQLKLRKKNLMFAPSNIDSWGLFALENIPAEEMIIEYVGELIRTTVADQRERNYGSAASYFFRINEDLVIDATHRGNLARFINHSCQPNCYAKIITIENEKKVVIYSKSEIRKGSEITYDYKFPIEDNKIECNCNAPKCRGFLN